MGLASSQFRLVSLTLQRSDFEYKLQLVSQSRMGLSNQINNILNIGTDLDPDAPEFKKLQARQQRLQMIDKKLEQQMLRFQTKLKMIETEIESVKKQVDSSIKRAFSY